MQKMNGKKYLVWIFLSPKGDSQVLHEARDSYLLHFLGLLIVIYNSNVYIFMLYILYIHKCAPLEMMDAYQHSSLHCH